MWTHAGRKAGLQQAEMLDIPDPQLRQLGRWEHSRMNQHYSHNIPRQALRVMAGQEEGTSGNFYLSRVSLVPPIELQRMIFPHLEESKRLVEALPDALRTKAADANLNTLDWFRVSILQDVVVLSDLEPACPLWRLPPFNLPAFQEYKQAAKLAMEDDMHPKSVQLLRLLPSIASALQTQSRVIDDSFKIMRNMREKDTTKMDQMIDNMNQMRQENIDCWTRLSNASHQFVDVLDGPLRIEPPPDLCSGTQTNFLIAPATSRMEIVSTVPPAQRLDPISRLAEIPRANLDTVPEVLEEWNDGLVGVGGQRLSSIREMNEKHQNTWRRDCGIRKRYERRRNIVDRIRKLAEKYGMDEETVAERVDLWRKENHHSVDKLGKNMHKDPDTNAKKEGWTDDVLMGVA